MSDFFESDTRATVAASGVVDREMRRQEMRRAATRKLATRVVAVALAGSLVLGGGFAAFAASHPSTKSVAVAHAHVKATKTKHKKHKKA